MHFSLKKDVSLKQYAIYMQFLSEPILYKRAVGKMFLLTLINKMEDNPSLHSLNLFLGQTVTRKS